MPFAQNFFHGQQISAFGVTGELISCPGQSLTDDVSYDLKALGTMDEMRINFRVMHEEMSPLDAVMENDVILRDAFTVDLGELTPIGGRSNLILLLFNYNYFKFVFKANCTGLAGDSALATFTIYAVRGDGSFEANRGKSPSKMQLRSCGIPITLTYAS